MPSINKGYYNIKFKKTADGVTLAEFPMPASFYSLAGIYIPAGILRPDSLTVRKADVFPLLLAALLGCRGSDDLTPGALHALISPSYVFIYEIFPKDDKGLGAGPADILKKIVGLNPSAKDIADCADDCAGRLKGLMSFYASDGLLLDEAGLEDAEHAFLAGFPEMNSTEFRRRLRSEMSPFKIRAAILGGQAFRTSDKLSLSGLMAAPAEAMPKASAVSSDCAAGILKSGCGPAHMLFSVDFASRRELYESFGDELFAIYSYLPYLWLGPLSVFQKKAFARHIMLSSDFPYLIESGEKTRLCLRCTASDQQLLAGCFARTAFGNRVRLSPWRFHQVRRLLANRRSSALTDPLALAESLFRAWGNNISINDCVRAEEKLSYGKMRAFLKKGLAFPYAVYAERGKG